MTLEGILPDDESRRPDVIVMERITAGKARAAIDAVVAGFVPRHREMFRLHHIEGRPMEECATLLGVGRARIQQIDAKIVGRLRATLHDHPAVMAMLRREPAPSEDKDDESVALLSIAEVEARTGLERKAITDMIGRGAFPRSVTKDNRGNRLWRESAVERWMVP
ncbi:MAG: sigma factor-like helix-turn-helix DNA-binding protein [Devosia sp.]